MTGQLRAPFPYFGGKSRAAHLVWAAFGDVPNYVEPFAGSLAVLLSRPTAPRIETVNDLDAHLANFWRAVQADAEAVARWADWPVNEVDLHTRHRWLVYGEGAAEFREAMRHEGIHSNLGHVRDQLPMLRGDAGAAGAGIHAQRGLFDRAEAV